MKTLRYTGQTPTTFMNVGEKQPQETFTVEDKDADAYLPREDIEEVVEDTPAEPVQDAAPRKGKAAKAVTPDEPATPEATEGS